MVVKEKKYTDNKTLSNNFLKKTFDVRLESKIMPVKKNSAPVGYKKKPHVYGNIDN